MEKNTMHTLAHQNATENELDPRELPTADARYIARVRGGKIDMTRSDLPLELNQMIVWIMHNPDAVYLLPAYRSIRQQREEDDEGSAKNHGLEV
jgi:hypothetical protein